ncbi:hypothetical protein Rumeso_02571 [Rubellimicrobium mesophilum DSM 19309]|uniref:Uncharacterized protein n=1 Tax=Rubellimicrobium mesophilum DSM 19309 TaxID=442562 RepID=A0A017HPU6_9RHOB|nr:hypothetical protein [Rubellimicrobium mesophilum]EYD75789.1 hypothetical protein Rumeso_02571 [Rubellimicrobium mesophilum DSM 19309]
MRIVVHVGMHKTGSTAIQQHFGKLLHRGFEYATYEERNHSMMVALLFSSPDRLADFYVFRQKGPAYVAALPDLRGKWQSRLDAQLDRLRGTDATVLISAEGLSTAGPAANERRENLARYLDRLGADIEVVGYVRSPLSFIRSDIQQRLKDLSRPIQGLEVVWPHYRKRFEPLDQSFGRDRVRLKVFRPDRLHGGDVVSDLGRLLGIDVPPGSARRVNETLSLEATAFLYAQRRWGGGEAFGSPEALKGSHRFVKALSGLKGRRMTVAEPLWRDALARNAEDLAWMEARLGEPLREQEEGDARIAIGSEDDLMAVAIDSLPQLEGVLRDTISTRRFEELALSDLTPQHRMLRALQALRQATAA